MDTRKSEQRRIGFAATRRYPTSTKSRCSKTAKVLFDYSNRFGFEGVVSKRRQSGYASGSSSWWVKVKCPHWKRANSER
jgi:ATP-dependent DNA ligase